jgi:amidase
LAESLDHIGPMARTVSDVAAMLEVIAGADAQDPTALQASVPDYLHGIGTGIEGLTVGVDWAFATRSVAPAMAAAFTEAVAVLETLGAHIRTIRLPRLPVAEVMPLLTAEMAAAHEETFPARAGEYGPALAASLRGAERLSGVTVAKALTARLRFSGELARVFEDVDLIATPTTPRGAPPWEEAEARLMRYTLPFDMSGSPALSIPCGFDEDGLPLSLQLIGRHLAEDVVCRVGHAFQSATDWHSRRPALE